MRKRCETLDVRRETKKRWGDVLRPTSYALLLVLCLAACGGTSIFQPIATQMANPLTVAVDSAGARAYVVNSNNKFLFTQGSLHVVNIATPTSPTRLNSTAIDSFAGKIYLDVANRFAYLSNRLSDNAEDTIDALVRVNIDEASSSFLSTTKFAADGNPFGLAIFAPNNWLLTPTREGFLDFYDLNATPNVQKVSLKRTLSDGTSLTTADVSEVVVIGRQAVLSSASGGLLVVNLDELTTANANPVDYYISDIASPRGLATDGTFVYVANVETDANAVQTPSLLVLNLASLTASTTNTTTAVKDKDTDGLLSTSFTIGTDPQQVVVGTAQGFVSNFGSDNVTIFSLGAGAAKLADVTVGDEPFGMALYSPGGVNTHLLVCNVQSNTVSVVDLGARAVVGTYQ